MFLSLYVIIFKMERRGKVQYLLDVFLPNVKIMDPENRVLQ